jgi:hypothetical protein
MPATARRSKSEAYEKGIREGKAMAARARNMEPEEEGEEEEEEEMDMAMQPGHSRKRGAKGAKHTKPAADGYGMKKPMDAECGCSSKKGGKCDGNCGSMRKRSDSLTPLEYLDACELGIQDRSTAYIRARLDAAERLDLKCGKGSISEGEKCTKGAAQKVNPVQRVVRAYKRNRANSQAAQAEIKAMNPKWKKQYEKAKAKGASRQELTKLSIKQAGEIDKILRKNTSNVWADGFSSDSSTYEI